MGSKVFVQSYLIASDKKTAGHNPQASWDGEEYQEVILGQAQVISEAVVTLSSSLSLWTLASRPQSCCWEDCSGTGRWRGSTGCGRPCGAGPGRWCTRTSGCSHTSPCWWTTEQKIKQTINKHYSVSRMSQADCHLALCQSQPEPHKALAKCWYLFPLCVLITIPL